MKTLQHLGSLVVFFMARSVFAQFTPALIQNDSYWGDGKAEYSIYGAELVREGASRQCEVVHILVREAFDSKQLVKTDDPKRADAFAALKMNQIMTVPVGLLTYQQMHSSFWRSDESKLVKFSLTSSDSYGNTYKEARRNGEQFAYEYRTYSDGIANGQENIAVPPNGYFYDELPWLVRTIDFTKPSAEFEIQLAGSVINPKKDTLAFQPAKISFTSNERSLEVKVRHAAGQDHFTLDRQFPHLLREWKAADGNHLKMKRNLKVDYWNYTKPGDRERALNNPMLRLPD
ncbi:MAG: hypothetical protein ACJ8JD_03590 [Chthoniobacterales bacterium]